MSLGIKKKKTFIISNIKVNKEDLRLGTEVQKLSTEGWQTEDPDSKQNYKQQWTEGNLMGVILRTLLLLNLNAWLSLITTEKYYEQRYAVNHSPLCRPHTSSAATVWAPRVFQGSETFPRNLSDSWKGSS